MFAEELEFVEPEAVDAPAPATPPWLDAIGIRTLRREKRGPRTPRSLPVSRADCIDGPRPCPHVSCRHNLFSDVTWAGSLILRAAEPEDMPPDGSCSLDVADIGGMSQDDVARYLGIARQRVTQIEEEALAKMRGDVVLQELAGE